MFKPFPSSLNIGTTYLIRKYTRLYLRWNGVKANLKLIIIGDPVLLIYLTYTWHFLPFGYLQSKIFKMFREMFEAAICDSPPKKLIHCSQVCVLTRIFLLTRLCIYPGVSITFSIIIYYPHLYLMQESWTVYNVYSLAQDWFQLWPEQIASHNAPISCSISWVFLFWQIVRISVTT